MARRIAVALAAISLVSGSLLAVPPHARARTGDGTFGVLRRPASTHPALVLAGGHFEIRCDAPTDATGWWAELRVGGTRLPIRALDLVSSTYDSIEGQWVLEALVPADTPQDVYDLHVGFDGAEDSSLTAVKVYRAWPTRYRVVHISDTQNLFAVPGITDQMDELVADVNVVAPDFVINTGDLTTYGRVAEYRDFLAVAETTEVPTFHVPGNHDIFWTACWDREAYQRRYEDFIGERDYAFTFGSDLYVGVELSGYQGLCPYANLSEDQATFVDGQLSTHSAAPLAVLFGHQLEHSADVLETLATDHALDFYLYGHIHEDAVEEIGPTVFAAVGWAGDGLFRVLYVEGGAVVDYTYRDDPVASVPGGGAFSLDPGEEVDGERVVTLATTLDDDFPGVPVRIEVSPAPEGQHWAAEGGDLWQVVEGDGATYLYVRDATIPAASSATVRAFLEDDPMPDPDGGVPVDAGPPARTDAGPPERDAGSSPIDAGSVEDLDASVDGGATSPASDDGGCSCRVAARGSGPSAWLLVLAVPVIASRLVRRRRCHLVRRRR